MQNGHLQQLSSLPGFVGFVAIDPNLQLINNTTDVDSEVMAGLSGELIGYLRASRSISGDVLSVSIVCHTCLFYICSINDGYLLLQFTKTRQLAGVRESLNPILEELRRGS